MSLGTNMPISRPVYVVVIFHGVIFLGVALYDPFTRANGGAAPLSATPQGQIENGGEVTTRKTGTTSATLEVGRGQSVRVGSGRWEIAALNPDPICAARIDEEHCTPGTDIQ
jgi:hypothetical protein